MDRALPAKLALIALSLCLPWLIAAAGPSNILVRYSFDDDDIATGPDTFRVFERARGSVKLASAYRLSGYNSVEIRDTAGDRDFPELQGYFKLRRSGKLFAHFAFLTTDPNDLLNIALAGPKWFALAKDGIAFWLKSEDGFLWQMSDSMPVKLFPLRAFVWYVADVVYDIDEGVYDLTIREERVTQPLVDLQAQKNAASQPGSAVDKFSFVTDPFTDRSNLTYYVDDVMIGADRSVTQSAYAAPGRRKLFVDYWADQQRRLRKRPGCVAVNGPADLGLDEADLRAIEPPAFVALMTALESGRAIAEPSAGDVSKRTREIFEAFGQWQAGCRALRKRQGAAALAAFDDALARMPRAKMYSLSRVLALASLGRWSDVDHGLNAAYGDWQGDVRYDIVAAMLGIARPDLEAAETWLREPAEKIAGELGSEIPDSLVRRVWAGELDRDVITRLQSSGAGDWQPLLHQAAVAEEYFFVLLWRGAYDDAERYATRMIDRLEFLAAPNMRWLERAGNAAFFRRDYDGARGYYERCLEADADSGPCLLKLSDVSFALGDADGEQRYRERMYGSLVRRSAH